MVSELRALANLISEKVDEIEAVLLSKGLSLPSLDSNETYTKESELGRNDPQVADACKVVAGAADRLISSVYSPVTNISLCAVGVSERRQQQLKS